MKDYTLIAAIIAVSGLIGAGLALIFGWTVWISVLIAAAVPALIIVGMMLMMLAIVAWVSSLGGNK